MITVEDLSTDSLEDRLNQGLTRRLTIVSGYDASACGSALDNWLTAIDAETLLVRCHDESKDCAVPRMIFDGFAAAGLLEQPGEVESDPKRTEASLVEILNRLASLPRDLVIMLLDYRESDAAGGVVSFLLDHLPQHVHIYLICESVPGLRCIPRLCVRQELQVIDVAIR